MAEGWPNGAQQDPNDAVPAFIVLSACEDNLSASRYKKIEPWQRRAAGEFA